MSLQKKHRTMETVFRAHTQKEALTDVSMRSLFFSTAPYLFIISDFQYTTATVQLALSHRILIT